MIKFEKVKVGMRLWDYHSERCGNTMLRRWSNWSVDIKEVREDGCVVVWNSLNAPEFYSRSRIERLRTKPGKERDPFSR